MKKNSTVVAHKRNFIEFSENFRENLAGAIETSNSKSDESIFADVWIHIPQIFPGKAGKIAGKTAPSCARNSNRLISRNRLFIIISGVAPLFLFSRAIFSPFAVVLCYFSFGFGCFVRGFSPFRKYRTKLGAEWNF